MRWTRRRWMAAACTASTAPPAWTAPPATSDSDLLALAAGVPTVLVFWATYCAFCRRHNAHVDKLFRSVDAQRLRVIGVAVDSDAAGVQRYMHTQGFSFPVLLDRNGLRQRFTQRRLVPMTCLVDRDGKPGLCIPGEMTEDDVLQLARLALPRQP